MSRCIFKILIVFAAFISLKNATAQEFLSLEEAVRRGLAKNFDIRITQVDLQQAEVNNTIGNAGMLPNVSLASSYTASRSNTKLELSNGTVQENPNAANSNLTADALINWTIFDGGRMFFIKRQLNQNVFISQDQLKLQIQATVSRIIKNYARAVLLKQQLVAIDTALALAHARLEISRIKYESGISAKTDFLQARVDYTARKTDSVYATLNLINSFDSLNLLLGINEDQKYIVEDSLPINLDLKNTLFSELENNSLELNIYRRNIEVARLDRLIAASYRLPEITFSGGYRFTKSTSATGFALFSRSYGPSGNVGVNLPLFNGGNINRNVKIAGLQLFRQNLFYERQLTTVGRNYRVAWRNYVFAKDVYFLQKENLSFAKENVDVQKARFRVGIGTTLESRQAENDYLVALSNYYTSVYNMILNQTTLLELENKLVE